VTKLLEMPREQRREGLQSYRQRESSRLLKIEEAQRAEGGVASALVENVSDLVENVSEATTHALHLTGGIAAEFSRQVAAMTTPRSAADTSRENSAVMPRVKCNVPAAAADPAADASDPDPEEGAFVLVAPEEIPPATATGSTPTTAVAAPAPSGPLNPQRLLDGICEPAACRPITPDSTRGKKIMRGAAGLISCLLLTTHYALLTTYYSLLTTHYSLPTTHYPLPTTHYPLPTIHYSLLTTYDLLLTTDYLLLTTYYLLLTTYYLLLTTYYLGAAGLISCCRGVRQVRPAHTSSKARTLRLITHTSTSQHTPAHTNTHQHHLYETPSTAHIPSDTSRHHPILSPCPLQAHPTQL
jgi:hypothetical protein